MDNELRNLMAPVLCDLLASGLAAPRVEGRNWTGDPDVAAATLWSPNGSSVGVSVHRSAPLIQQIVDVADQVQDWAIEELQRQGSPTNWPPCPHHPDNHPLKATTQDDAAVWSCPLDQTPFAAIGAVSS